MVGSGKEFPAILSAMDNSKPEKHCKSHIKMCMIMNTSVYHTAFRVKPEGLQAVLNHCFPWCDKNVKSMNDQMTR